VTRRRGRRRKQLLYYLKETRGYWKLKEESLDRSLCRSPFRRGYGPVVRQTTEWMNEWMNAMKACGGVEVQLQTLLILELDGGEWSAARPSRVIPGVRSLGNRVGEPQSRRSGSFVEISLNFLGD
jgi:hypothetical protein